MRDAELLLIVDDNVDNLKAVSYTHLDVYKRQHLRFVDHRADRLYRILKRLDQRALPSLIAGQGRLQPRRDSPDIDHAEIARRAFHRMGQTDGVGTAPGREQIAHVLGGLTVVAGEMGQ